MANPSCPRCLGHTELLARDPDHYRCRECDHTFTDNLDDQTRQPLY